MTWPIHVAFAAGIAAFVLVDGLSVTPGAWGLTFKVLSAAGVYAVVHAVAMVVANGVLYRWVKRGESLHGEWWQILEIHPSAGKTPVPIRDRFRYGSCRIVHTAGVCAVSAESWRLDQSLSSTWRSELADYTRDRMLMLFVSESSSNERGPTRGTMHLTVYDRPPQRIVGTFADATPARNAGVIYLMRSKERYEAMVRELRQHMDETVEVHVDPDTGTVHLVSARD